MPFPLIPVAIGGGALVVTGAVLHFRKKGVIPPAIAQAAVSLPAPPAVAARNPPPSPAAVAAAAVIASKDQTKTAPTAFNIQQAIQAVQVDAAQAGSSVADALIAQAEAEALAQGG